MTTQVPLPGLNAGTRPPTSTRRGGDSPTTEGRQWRWLLHHGGPERFLDAACAHQRARRTHR